MGFKKMLTMAGLSLVAATGSVKAATSQEQPSSTSTPARVEQSVKKAKGQMSGFISYPDFFPIDQKGEFDREKSLELIKKIPLQKLRDAFQEYNAHYPETAEKLLDLLSMGNSEIKGLLKQMLKSEYMKFKEFKKIITQEESEKLAKRREKAVQLRNASVPFVVGGLSAMFLMALAGVGVEDTKFKSKLSTPIALIGGMAGIIGISAMITTLSSAAYGYCAGSNSKMTLEGAQKNLVDIHQQFFETYKEQQIRQKLTKLGDSVAAGKNEGDNALVTMTIGELRTLIESSHYDHSTAFYMHAIKKLTPKSK